MYDPPDDWLNVSVTNSLAQILGEIDKNQLEEADDAIDEAAAAVGTSEDSLGAAGAEVSIVGANLGRGDVDDDDVNGGSRGDDNDYSGSRAV